MIASEKYSPDTAHFVYRCHYSLPWVEISALASEANTLLTRKFVSGVQYPYNSDKSNAQKTEISSKRIFTATRELTKVPLVVLG